MIPGLRKPLLNTRNLCLDIFVQFESFQHRLAISRLNSDCPRLFLDVLVNPINLLERSSRQQVHVHLLPLVNVPDHRQLHLCYVQLDVVDGQSRVIVALHRDLIRNFRVPGYVPVKVLWRGFRFVESRHELGLIHRPLTVKWQPRTGVCDNIQFGFADLYG